MVETKAQATQPLKTILLVATNCFSYSVLKRFKNTGYFFTSRPHRNAANKVELHAKKPAPAVRVPTFLFKLLLMPLASHVHMNRSKTFPK